MGWVNKITLDRYVHHDAARKKLSEILVSSKHTEDDILKIVITADGGYVHYQLVYRDFSESLIVFDDGNVI